MIDHLPGYLCRFKIFHQKTTRYTNNTNESTHFPLEEEKKKTIKQLFISK